MMAVLAQSGLLPMAFTRDATQDGPEPLFDPGWSDTCALGVTQVHGCELAALNVVQEPGCRSEPRC